jgi:hypothetical protein
MALAWWLVPCLPFPGLLHIYFLFTVRLTNERVRVFLVRHSVQHLVEYKFVNRKFKKRGVGHSPCHKCLWSKQMILFSKCIGHALSLSISP